MPPEVPLVLVPWYRHRWFKLTLIVIGVIALIAAILAAVVVIIWNASPEKALFDSASYALNTPGTYHVKASNTDIRLDVNGRQYAASGTLNGMQIDAVVNNSTLYIKSSDPQQLYTMFLASSVPGSLAPLVNSILPAFRDRWISVDLQNLSPKSANASAAQCGLDGKNILVADSNSRQQVATTYIMHQFLDIKSSSSSGRSTYQVSIDDKKFNDFYDSFAKTGFYQSLTSCSQATSTSVSRSLQGVSLGLTVDQSSHQLKSLSINQSGEVTDVTADYSAAPKITVPTGATSYDQISGTIVQSFLKSFLGGR